jgi:hypothetical protein
VRKLRVYLSLPLSVAFVVSAVSCPASMLTYMSIDYPGASETGAKGINSAGVIVGYYNNLGLHGFVKSGNVFTSIDYPGSTATLIFGINDAMQMVGVYQMGSVFHGFEDDAGVFTSFDFPGATDTRTNAINDGGTVVGNYSVNDNVHAGYQLALSSYTSFMYPGAQLTFGGGINDTGQIVGSYFDGSQYHGFVKDSNGFTSIDYPGGPDTQAKGINDNGLIVGLYQGSSGVPPNPSYLVPNLGFLKDGANFTTLSFPGAFTTDATGINNNGLIVGQYGAADGTYHGYVASVVPTPEPTSLGLFAAGLAALLAYRMRRTTGRTL